MSKYKIIFFSEITDKILNYILIILFLGVFLNVIMFPQFSYIDFLFYIINSSWLFAFLIIPIILFVNYKVLIYFEKNYMLLSRLNKKNIYVMKIKTSIYVTSILYSYVTILIVILANLFAVYQNVFHVDEVYNVSNVFLFIISYIKLYIFINILMILEIGLKELMEKNKYIILIYFLFISLFQNLYIIEEIPILKYVNPSRYFNITYVFPSFLSNIVQSSIYLLMFLFISYFVSKNILYKKEELGDEV